MENKNSLLLFFAASFLFIVVWMQAQRTLWPPVKNAPLAEATDSDVAIKAIAGPWADLRAGKKPAAKPAGLALKAIAGPWADLKGEPKKHAPPAAKPAPVARMPAAVPPTPVNKLLTLGDVDQHSRYHLKVALDPRGAGVRDIVLNKFQEADSMGRPRWRDTEKKIPFPLVLVPGLYEGEVPSNLLYHFRNPDDDRPMDTLGKALWKVAGPIERDHTPDGRERQKLAFETEIQGVRITKTFTLAEGDYHIGLEVMLLRLPTEHTPKPFRYQLTGARRLPIEGRWYTSTFRNALIGRGQPGNIFRDMQTSQEIGLWEGGNEVLKEPGRPIRYAAVAVQYFASAIVVDNEQKNQDFLKEVRPTLETAVARGQVTEIDPDRHTFVLTIGEHDKRTFHLADDPAVQDQFDALQKHTRRAVVYHTTGQPEGGGGRFDINVATRIAPEMSVQPRWEEDITVRVATETLELKPGEPVSHKYLLYNGPVKPSLLAGQRGEAAVRPSEVDRYAYDLSLNTMTDYHSPGPVGRFANAIYWSQLIIRFTNLMHQVLGILHLVLPSYGICIIVLTVMVRGIMFPLSRKQALMSMKMQELAPELKRIQERYKDDPQGRGVAQMDLYRRQKINPFGSCWVMLLQMPVFMGLYFALQESIQFRLAPFWPTWIKNLAAPDMTIWWGEGIPVISQPESYGGIFYLGPYFNLLPVVAVVLMIFQQKLMTPPATNQEEAQRNAMMKYMMIFMGLMFYKVASGLCLYFIASSLWSFAERKLLPKKKASAQAEPADGLLQRLRGSSPAAPVAATESGTRGSRGRQRSERSRREEDESTLGRLRAWWQEVLKQAAKK